MVQDLLNSLREAIEKLIASSDDEANSGGEELAQDIIQLRDTVRAAKLALQGAFSLHTPSSLSALAQPVAHLNQGDIPPEQQAELLGQQMMGNLLQLNEIQIPARQGPDDDHPPPAPPVDEARLFAEIRSALIGQYSWPAFLHLDRIQPVQFNCVPTLLNIMTYEAERNSRLNYLIGRLNRYGFPCHMLDTESTRDSLYRALLQPILQVSPEATHEVYLQTARKCVATKMQRHAAKKPADFQILLQYFGYSQGMDANSFCDLVRSDSAAIDASVLLEAFFFCYVWGVNIWLWTDPDTCVQLMTYDQNVMAGQYDQLGGMSQIHLLMTRTESGMILFSPLVPRSAEDQEKYNLGEL